MKIKLALSILAISILAFGYLSFKDVTEQPTIDEVIGNRTPVEGDVIAIEKPSPLTFDEWHEIVEMYEYEIKQLRGKINLGEVKSQKEVFDKLNAKIRERTVVEKVALDGLSKESYEIKREELLTKIDNIWTR